MRPDCAAMNWYYVRDGQRMGPVSEDEIRQLAVSGGLRPDDLVWNESMGEQWQPASMQAAWFVDPATASAVLSGLPAPAPSSGFPGQTPNEELMTRARASLKGQWGTAVAITVIYMIITYGLSFIPFPAGTILVYLVGGPLYLGFSIAFLRIARAKGEVGDLFAGFQHFGKALATYLLMVLFLLLWTLLLIVPGIIKSYAYMMTFFVLAENPSLGAREAIRRSEAMMRGNKWKLFCLYFRFLGWALLAILTCGIGMLWLMPYMQTAMAHFYDDVRGAADKQVA